MQRTMWVVDSVGMTKSEFLIQRTEVEKVSTEIAEFHWSQLMSCKDTKKDVDHVGNTRVFVQVATKRRARSFESLNVDGDPFPPLATPEPEARALSEEPEITIAEERVTRSERALSQINEDRRTLSQINEDLKATQERSERAKADTDRAMAWIEDNHIKGYKPELDPEEASPSPPAVAARVGTSAAAESVAKQQPESEPAPPPSPFDAAAPKATCQAAAAAIHAATERLDAAVARSKAAINSSEEVFHHYRTLARAAGLAGALRRQLEGEPDENLDPINGSMLDVPSPVEMIPGTDEEIRANGCTPTLRVAPVSPTLPEAPVSPTLPEAPVSPTLREAPVSPTLPVNETQEA